LPSHSGSGLKSIASFPAASSPAIHLLPKFESRPSSSRRTALRIAFNRRRVLKIASARTTRDRLGSARHQAPSEEQDGIFTCYTSLFTKKWTAPLFCETRPNVSLRSRSFPPPFLTRTHLHVPIERSDASLQNLLTLPVRVVAVRQSVSSLYPPAVRTFAAVADGRLWVISVDFPESFTALVPAQPQETDRDIQYHLLHRPFSQKPHSPPFQLFLLSNSSTTLPNEHSTFASLSITLIPPSRPCRPGNPIGLWSWSKENASKEEKEKLLSTATDRVSLFKSYVDGGREEGGESSEMLTFNLDPVSARCSTTGGRQRIRTRKARKRAVERHSEAR
jgi:hypothetical protein